ncbi:MAG: membrane protein insertion efficiency factor YidD [Nitrospiraceae bacterium]|nr:membrane protein insertion efficiency factor YidD [Nitrospiraceae bacterium]
MQGLISLYQRYISPFLPQSCRFYPSCSEYARLSFKQYPFHRALIKSLFRILRCHPFHPGGVDLP